MKKIYLELTDQLSLKLETYAKKSGLELDEFLIKAISQDIDEVLIKRPKTWMPREQWDSLVRGENCPECEHLETGATSHTYPIADLRISRLDLHKNQFVAGYCVLYCYKHVQEPYHLTLKKRELYFEDLIQAAQTIERVYHSLKMNYQILGNASPHLHCHLIPRYYGDPASNWPLNPGRDRVTLAPEAYEAQISAIRDALK